MEAATSIGGGNVVEVAKRLAPTKDTVFELGAKSGNECAYPNCTERMFNEQGVMIGQICHIEAAEKGGQRFNDAMTNEQRRHISNLMLMCYQHHKITDDVNNYPTSRMKDMKQAHEARFTEEATGELLHMLKDWTLCSDPTPAVNLRRLNRILGWGLGDRELHEMVAELADYAMHYRRVPSQAREILMKVVERMELMEGTKAVSDKNWGPVVLRASDFESAFRLEARVVAEYGQMLGHYNIGDFGVYPIDRFSDRDDYGICIYNLNSGWPMWSDLFKFAKQAGIPFKNLAVNADFSLLDE